MRETRERTLLTLSRESNIGYAGTYSISLWIDIRRARRAYSLDLRRRYPKRSRRGGRLARFARLEPVCKRQFRRVERGA